MVGTGRVSPPPLPFLAQEVNRNFSSRCTVHRFRFWFPSFEVSGCRDAADCLALQLGPFYDVQCDSDDSQLLQVSLDDPLKNPLSLLDVLQEAMSTNGFSS